MDMNDIIGKLEALGVTLKLAIDYECETITPEIESLLRELSNDREAAIDALAGRRFVQLPNNTPIPAQFRSDRMNQIRHVFAVCYKLLELHEGASTEEQWHAAYNYHEGRLDASDPLAIELYITCVTELERQYRALEGAQ